MIEKAHPPKSAANMEIKAFGAIFAGTEKTRSPMGNKSIEGLGDSQSQVRSADANIKSTVKIVFVTILTIGVFVALYHVIKEIYPKNQVSQFSTRSRINLKSGKNTNAVPDTGSVDRPVIRVAIAPIVSPEKSLEMYQPFVDYVGEKLGRKPEALYRPTYSETNDLVRYKMCDLAIVCTYPFIRGEKEFGMQALVVPIVKGEETYQSLIVVPKTSRATSIFDLRGKRFASADVISTTGWLYPAMLLMGSGKDPNTFFGEHIITHSHDRSIQAVIDGFVDGAAIHGIVYDQMIAEDPTIPQKLKIISKSPPFGIPPIVVHPSLDPKLREEALSVLLNMDKDPQGKQILTKLQIERFVVPEPDLFAPLRLAVSKLEKWR
jgi:phosphonate transport system substrate-binding protein